jgi:hypothetical protein
VDPGTGFASGLIAGQEAQQSLAQGQQQLAMGGIKLKEEDVALQQAEMMLANQRKFAEYMTKLNSGGASPGQAAGDMANQLASRLFAVSDAALRSNMPEQASEILSKAEAVQKGHIELVQAATARQLQGATLTSNMVKNLDPNDPNATQEFHSRMLAWSSVMGEPPHPELVNAPFTKELKQRILDQAETVMQQATRQLEEQRLKQSQTETELAEKRKPLVEAQTRAADTLAKAREKAGSGHTKAEQKQVDALVDVNHDIDDMLRQLDSADDSEALTGLKGRFHSVAESVRGVTGVGDQATPAHDFETSMEALRLKLPRAMTGVSRSAKDEREAASILTDLRRPGITAKIAKQRLQKLKELNKGQITRSGVKPSEEESVESPRTTDDNVDVSNW